MSSELIASENGSRENSPQEVESALKAELAQNPYAKTKKIAFEISNRCNMAHAHTRCPLNLDYRQVKQEGGNYSTYYSCGAYLSDDQIRLALTSMGEFGYREVIAFHRYNEPLIELERCLELIAFARQACPDSDIMIYTNGLLIERDVLFRLIESGMTSLIVTAYSDRMYRRVQAICDEVKSTCTDRLNITLLSSLQGDESLDDRMDIYNRVARQEWRGDLSAPCLAPLFDVTVSCDGDVVLCCLDWKNEHAYGNLASRSLAEILGSEAMIATYLELSQGNRRRGICKACGWSRM